MRGGIVLGGNITWSAGSSPTQALYATTALTKPANGAKWSSYPSSGTGWHQTFASTDRYATYTYDGGGTWTTAVLIQGKDGEDGKNGKDGANGANGANGAPGRDGTDAQVTRANIANALLSANSGDGLFTDPATGTLTIRAARIDSGQFVIDGSSATSAEFLIKGWYGKLYEMFAINYSGTDTAPTIRLWSPEGGYVHIGHHNPQRLTYMDGIIDFGQATVRGLSGVTAVFA
jgi:hypothetical protein